MMRQLKIRQSKCIQENMHLKVLKQETIIKREK